MLLQEQAASGYEHDTHLMRLAAFDELGDAGTLCYCIFVQAQHVCSGHRQVACPQVHFSMIMDFHTTSITVWNAHLQQETMKRLCVDDAECFWCSYVDQCCDSSVPASWQQVYACKYENFASLDGDVTGMASIHTRYHAAHSRNSEHWRQGSLSTLNALSMFYVPRK